MAARAHESATVGELEARNTAPSQCLRRHEMPCPLGTPVTEGALHSCSG